jgi:acyl-CoA synthetase (AMP-forming)/AMP-acid ligase II
VLDVIEREGVTIWFSGPAILTGMASTPGLEERDLRSLRVVAFAGEAFPAAPLEMLRRGLRGPRYMNFYGSTETNVAAWYELPESRTFSHPPPIGRPCAHYAARIEPLPGEPAGSPGELWLRGPGLDAGYLGRPELTAERLVPAPNGGPPWYRTGDLVERLPDGNLRHAGRIGRMLKLRGYRVEPGEIERRLQDHPRISEAAVVPEEGPRGLRLVGHVAGERLPAVELKRFCAALLPAYMVPERFVHHVALPRNLRGKIDFAALREGAEEVLPAATSD